MENKIAFYRNGATNPYNKYTYYNPSAKNFYEYEKQKSTDKYIKKNKTFYNIYAKDYHSNKEANRSNSPYSSESINSYDFNNKTSTILIKKEHINLNKDNLFDEIEKIKSLTQLELFFKTHQQVIEKIINDIIKVDNQIFTVKMNFNKTPKIKIFINIAVPYYQNKQFKESLQKNLLNLREYCKNRKYVFIQTPPYFNKPTISIWEETSWDKKTLP